MANTVATVSCPAASSVSDPNVELPFLRNVNEVEPSNNVQKQTDAETASTDACSTLDEFSSSGSESDLDCHSPSGSSLARGEDVKDEVIDVEQWRQIGLRFFKALSEAEDDDDFF